MHFNWPDSAANDEHFHPPEDVALHAQLMLDLRETLCLELLQTKTVDNLVSELSGTEEVVPGMKNFVALTYRLQNEMVRHMASPQLSNAARVRYKQTMGTLIKAYQIVSGLGEQQAGLHVRLFEKSLREKAITAFEKYDMPVHHCDIAPSR